jgi:hypothetical protein
MSLSESPGSQLSLQPWSDRSQLSRWTGLLSQRKIDASIDFVRLQRLNSPGPFWPAFSAPKAPEFRANEPVTRASTAVGVVVLEPFQGVSGGTKNSPAPNDPKLGRLRRTRQGLVRVPESNTKYGGKLGKPGVAWRPLMPQVSVSPQGIPSEKNLPEASDPGLRPLFTGQVFFVTKGLRREDSREATGSPGWHAKGPMVSGWDNRQAARDSTGSFIP